MFNISQTGKFSKGRDIHLLKAGTGKTPVLLWSQMHGDGSTATQELFDSDWYYCRFFFDR